MEQGAAPQVGQLPGDTEQNGTARQETGGSKDDTTVITG